MKIRTEVSCVSIFISPDIDGCFAIPCLEKQDLDNGYLAIVKITKDLENIEGIKVEYDPTDMALEWFLTVEVKEKESLKDVINRVNKEFKKIWNKHVKDIKKGRRFDERGKFHEKLQSFREIKK